MMDILKRIDHAQQFCKFYADSSYSVETEKWKHHVTPKFIEDIRQYIESLQLKLMHLQTQQAEPVADGDKVICPACCHQFRGIPETVQTLMLHAGFEPPFTTPPQQQSEPDRRPLQAEGKHPAPCARHCEAKAFEIEIRSLKSALETQAASKEDMKVYRSIVDNYWKGLAAKAEQQAEPVQERITHITWDGRGVRTVNGIPDDAPRYKELSASEILNMMPSTIPADYDGPLMEFARAVEAKLKEKNNG